MKYFAMLLVSFFLLSGCGKKIETVTTKDPELLNYPALRLEIVKRVKSGEIKPDGNGVAILPEQLKTVSEDGKVYVSRPSPTELLVAFRSLPGKGFGEGFLYCEKALSKDTKSVHVGFFDLKIKNRIDDHWFQVGQ